MTPLEAFQEALQAQEAIITAQRVPERPVDALGRPRTACCGALALGDGDHAQCARQPGPSRETAG